jgi:hypothetical protein
MGDSGSPSERHNLQGQLRSGILLCISKGIIESAIEDFSEEIRTKIREEYQLKRK